MPDPIRIPCEGAGHRAHPFGPILGVCAMCGCEVVMTKEGEAPSHDRNDILAMLERGDFG